MPPIPRFRLLTFADVEIAARVMATAYIDDPLTSFILPSRRTRTATLYKFFRATGEISVKNRRVYGAGEPLQAVAYWKFPDQGDVSVSIKSLGKFLPLLFTAYPFGLYRAKPILREIDALHEKYAAQPHFYLDNIGVHPSARGRGLSSALIRPFLEMADERQVIVYTDTVTPANVPLYQHFGFQIVAESPIPNTGITVWALLRPGVNKNLGDTP